MEAISKEGYKLEVTEKAARLIAKKFGAHNERPVRLFVKLGVCGARSFVIVMENRLETDEIFAIDGFQFIIDKVLLKFVHPVKVDADDYAFRISGNGLPPQTACGSCGYRCADDIRCTGDCISCGHQCVYGLRRLKEKKKQAEAENSRAQR